jgi:hypothetical protein
LVTPRKNRHEWHNIRSMPVVDARLKLPRIRDIFFDFQALGRKRCGVIGCPIQAPTQCPLAYMRDESCR